MNRNPEFKFIIFNFIFNLIIIGLLPQHSLAQWETNPKIAWKVLHTPHFEIIHSVAHHDLAVLYAEKLEKAHKNLMGYFSEPPPKVSVVINDKTDVTNGYATIIPYPHIVAYPVLPGPEEGLANTGDWAYELLAHEYTHILNMQPANGIMTPLRKFLGSVVAPNLLLPTWWKEGLAVEMETRLSQHGRLRSFFQDASIRAMVIDNTFFEYDLARANEKLPIWPEGSTPYLFGSLMWSQILADHGEKAIEQLNQHHSRRIPYLIEEPAQTNLKNSYSGVYSKALNETSARAQNQIKTLNISKPNTSLFIELENEKLSAPAISPDGKKLAYIQENDSGTKTVYIVTKTNFEKRFQEEIHQNYKSGKPSVSTKNNPTGSIQRVSWFPDSQRVVYDKIDAVNSYDNFSDLHVYDLASDKTEPLSHGLRGREPSVALDGQSISFVKLSAGKTELALMDLKDPSHPIKILFSAPMTERVSYPTFTSEKEIVFSWRNIQGQEHLFRYNLENSKTELLLSKYPDARFARMTSEGLLFNSSKNGVQNIYLANAKLTDARPISHTLTGLYTADIDPLNKDLIATAMTSTGFDLTSIRQNEWKLTPAILPHIEPLLYDRYSNIKKAESESFSLSQDHVSEYSATSYLWPRYWVPFLAGSATPSGIMVQAATSGFDPLKKHTYSLSAAWDSALDKISLDGSYLNQAYSLPFSFSAFNRNSYLGDTSHPISDFAMIGSVTPNTFNLSRYSSLQMGIKYLESTSQIKSVKRIGPFGILSYQNYSRSAAEISPESGHGMYLGVFDFLPQENFLNHWQFLLGGEKYLNSFLPKHHAMMFRAKGIYTPEKISSIYGAATDSIILIRDNPMPEYSLRGYQRGQIFGKNLINLNLEYRFPIKSIYRGSGTDPIFFKRISGAFIADGASADGAFIDPIENIIENISTNRWFWSAGFETHIETTLGYVFPISFVAGFYQAFNTYRGSESTIGTSIQISGF